jgi:hypothetical protein
VGPAGAFGVITLCEQAGIALVPIRWSPPPDLCSSMSIEHISVACRRSNSIVLGGAGFGCFRQLSRHESPATAGAVSQDRIQR